jgi:Protein of unknown function (DUF1761)
VPYHRDRRVKPGDDGELVETRGRLVRRKINNPAERNVMNFAGVDSWAILLAATGGYIVGAFWYWGFSKLWMEMQGFTPESLKSSTSVATALAGVVGHLGVGEVTLTNAVISAFLLWFGFIAMTLAANYCFGGRPLKLYLIDAGHWLAVLLVQGIVIGAMGV